MHIAITGARGFIGRNLTLTLKERNISFTTLKHDTSQSDLRKSLEKTTHLIHLAGVNRPTNEKDFKTGNTDFTKRLCSVLEQISKAPLFIFTSSTQASLNNPYGKSKKAAEDALITYAQQTANPIVLYRLPNVFGKWCRPNYNSAIATFCHNLIHDKPITIHDATAPLTLLYIDDFIHDLLKICQIKAPPKKYFQKLPTTYQTTVGEVHDLLKSFHQSRATLTPGKVGTGLERALYATYLSHKPSSDFAYALKTHEDERGCFAEMLRTPDCGQISFFTAHPDVTRGGHYHHTKNEKFLVVSGEARFTFIHMESGERSSLITSAKTPQIVETVPGWAHDITNIGKETLTVMLWANELFDPDKPDTIYKDMNT